MPVKAGRPVKCSLFEVLSQHAGSKHGLEELPQTDERMLTSDRESEPATLQNPLQSEPKGVEIVRRKARK